MRSLRTFAIGAVTVALLLGSLLLTQMDFAAIAGAASQLTIIPLMLAASLLIAGALLAVLRLWCISADIGTPLSFRDAMLALSLGQIAGAISVQFFGQIAARAALLGRRGISNSANIVMATYERAAAVFVSAGMATCGAINLFGKLSFDIEQGGAQFLTIVAGMTCIVIAGAATVWGRYALPIIRELMTPKVAKAVFRNALLTMLIQFCTAGAYVMLAHNLSPDTTIQNLIAASLVVMFAASLPISFSGWGLREISAVFVLGTVGIAAAVALTISIAIGALALIAVIFVAGAAVVSTGELTDDTPGSGSQRFELTNFLKWALPIAAATAVFFQIYVPTGATNLSVNLADPIAVLGGMIFVSEYGRNAQWRLPGLPFFAAIATLILFLSYLHGYVDFGSNHWASVNRLLGWLIVLGYVATGALVVAKGGERGAVLFAKAFIVTAASIVVFWACIIFANRIGVVLPKGVLVEPLADFSQNRNAFSFGLLMAICALPLVLPRQRLAAFTILAFGLWVSNSFAACGSLVVVAGLLVYFRIMSLRAVGGATLMVAVAVALFHFAPYFSEYFGARGGDFNILVNFSARESSNLERFISLQGGFALFLQHPLFGAGLGQFIESQTIGGIPLVIHSTPIWLLAETGIVGLLAFAGPAAWLYVREFARRDFDPISQVIVLVLTTFAIMSEVHELMFQRPLWLLLGVALFSQASIKSSGTVLPRVG